MFVGIDYIRFSSLFIYNKHLSSNYLANTWVRFIFKLTKIAKLLKVNLILLFNLTRFAELIVSNLFDNF